MGYGGLRVGKGGLRVGKGGLGWVGSGWIILSFDHKADPHSQNG